MLGRSWPTCPFTWGVVVAIVLSGTCLAQDTVKISVTNATRFPIQLVFVRSGSPCRSFAVRKIKPTDEALLEGVMLGKWHIVAFDLASGDSLASSAFNLTPQNNRSLEIRPKDPPARGYEIRSFGP
jgi:hypothetical protein